MFEEIKHDDITMALILSADHSAEGIQFLTPNEFSQQLGYMNRPKGYVIPPHVHNPVKECALHQSALYKKWKSSCRFL